MFSKSEFSLFSKEYIHGPERVLIRGGLTLVAIGTTGYILNKVFNSPPVVASFEESRTIDDSSRNRVYSATVREHLRATYAHFAVGLIMTGGFAYFFSHRVGWSTRLMKANKWMFIGGTLFFTFGSAVATQIIDHHKNPALKYTAWTLFNSSLGLILSPLCLLESSLLAHAALLSAGVVASISIVGMTTRREQYLWLGAPSMIGLSVICLASIGSTILPATAMKSLSAMEIVSLYGGLAILSGVLLFDTQKMIDNAEKAQDARTLSSIDESLDIYLDTIDIFVRILAFLSKDDERKKKRSALTSNTE